MAAHRNGAPQPSAYRIRLVLLGECGVGKSSLALRYAKSSFSVHHETTVGAALLTQTEYLEDTTINFEIWDTAGQERFHSLAPMYYRGAQAALVVYDISDQVMAAHRNGAPQPSAYRIRLVLLGECGVGKSSLALRYAKSSFSVHHETTVGAALLTQTEYLEDTTINFEIWDTAGQERYHSIAPMYYRGAQAALVVYDISDQDSFIRARTWVKELQRQASPSIVIALAGNKSDLATKRMVEFEEAQAYADENGLLFMETSAKTAKNVNDIFLAIANRLPKSEGGSAAAGGARRLKDGEQPRASSCCK